MHDGEVAVQRDGDEDARAEVEAKGAEEHHQTTGSIPGQPDDRGMPGDLQGHHHERDQQVRDGQVHDEHVHARFHVAVAEERDEDCQIPAGRHQKEAGISDDGHGAVIVEVKFFGQWRHVVQTLQTSGVLQAGGQGGVGRTQ